jgi:hypothetical protein
MSHPEVEGRQGIEPSVGDLLALQDFLGKVDRMSVEQLKHFCRELGRQCLVAYPATVRWLTREVANGTFPAGKQWANPDELAQNLERQLLADGALKRPMPES